MRTAHNNKLFIFLLLIFLFVIVSAENLRWVEVKFRLPCTPIHSPVHPPTTLSSFYLVLHPCLYMCIHPVYASIHPTFSGDTEHLVFALIELTL